MRTHKLVDYKRCNYLRGRYIKNSSKFYDDWLNGCNKAVRVFRSKNMNLHTIIDKIFPIGLIYGERK